MANRRYFVWFGSFFLFTGIVLLIEGLNQYRLRERYRHQWIEAQAAIVRKWIVPATRDGATASEYRLQYMLQPPGHPPQTRVVLLDPEDWEPIREGVFIPVLYPQSAPQQSRLSSEGEPPSGLGELAGGLFASLFGAALAAWNLQRLRESRAPLLPHIPVWRTLRNIGAWILRIAAVLLFIGIAQSVPALQRLVAAIQPHESLYIAISVAVMLLGAAFFIAGLAGRGSDSFTLTEWNRAIRSGRAGDPQWRRRTRILTGAVLFALGFAGVFFAIGPAWIKAGVIAAILYTTFRVVRS